MNLQNFCRGCALRAFDELHGAIVSWWSAAAQPLTGDHCNSGSFWVTSHYHAGVVLASLLSAVEVAACGRGCKRAALEFGVKGFRFPDSLPLHMLA